MDITSLEYITLVEEKYLKYLKWKIHNQWMCFLFWTCKTSSWTAGPIQMAFWNQFGVCLMWLFDFLFFRLGMARKAMRESKILFISIINWNCVLKRTTTVVEAFVYLRASIRDSRYILRGSTACDMAME